MTFDTTTEFTAGDSSAAAMAGGEPVFLELDEVDGAAVGASQASDAEAAPGWFSRKRAKAKDAAKAAKSKPANKRLLPAIAVRPEDRPDGLIFEPTLLEKITYFLRGRSIDPNGELADNPSHRRFKQLLAFAATGYGVSVIMHAFLTAALLLNFIDVSSSSQLSLFASHSTDDIVEFDEIDTAIEMAGGAEETVLLPEMPVVNITSPDIAQPVEPVEMRPTDTGSGHGIGNSDGSSSGQRFAMPKSGKAVTKGSFTVWTIPEDPAPGQNYHIIIQVKLPGRLKRYRRSDLSGMVIGTDGYRQFLPGIKRGWVLEKDSRAQVAIFVPAAASLVRDRIEVRSKILKEQQKLEIVF